MLKQLLFVAFVLAAAPLAAQDPAYAADRQLVVEQVKQELLTRGYSFVIMDPPTDDGSEASRCSAFEITKRVAWRLRAEGVGLVAKAPGQKGCTVGQGRFSHDALMYPGGNAIDILEGSETKNKPAWNGTGAQPPANWRAPFDPGDTPVTPPPAPSPGLVSAIDYARFQQIVRDELHAEVGADRTKGDTVYAQHERTYNDEVKRLEGVAGQVTAVGEKVTALDQKAGGALKALGDVMAFAGKYIAPAVGAWIAAKKFG